MSTLRMQGLYPATVTPFDEDLKIDFAGLDAHLGATAEADGVRGLVVNGHVGEVLQLSSTERADIVRHALTVRRPGQPVIAGIEANTADDLVREATNAAEAGADGLLVLPPIDVRPYRRLAKHPASVMHYFEALDKQVGLPTVVHQYPDFTGCAYSIEVLREVVALDSVVAIKAASFSPTRYAEVWDAFHDDVAVLAATDAPALLGMLLHGAHGALIGIGVIDPPTWAELIAAATGGDAERARQVFLGRCVPLMDTVFENQEPTELRSEAASTKEALVQLGQFASSRVRPPACDVDDEARAEIGATLERIGLLRPTAHVSR
ncbi:dihydrodipicolinate synthase family protein [Phytohabitans kaempferiae]|uniref:Dihydrodipicolinate synthase family protein n=1 Tax=Phytohabitans kaempferiae TaxID=1620943 RepID=A0ABV6MH33_9ACTN